jgi:hypothetical protein
MAVEMLRRGATPTIVGKALGHASSDTMAVYTDLARERMDEEMHTLFTQYHTFAAHAATKGLPGAPQHRTDNRSHAVIDNRQHRLFMG